MGSGREGKLLGAALLRRLGKAGFKVNLDCAGATIIEGRGMRLCLRGDAAAILTIRDTYLSEEILDVMDDREQASGVDAYPGPESGFDWREQREAALERVREERLAERERRLDQLDCGLPTDVDSVGGVSPLVGVPVDGVPDDDDTEAAAVAAMAEVSPEGREVANAAYSEELGGDWFADMDSDDTQDDIESVGFAESLLAAEDLVEPPCDGLLDDEPALSVDTVSPYVEYWSTWFPRWGYSLMYGVPGSGLFTGGRSLTAGEAGAAGERALADALDQWRDGEVLSTVPSYWSMAMPDDDSYWLWHGDVDCVLDLGRTLVLVDAKNYSYRGSQYTVTPDGSSLYALRADGGVAEAHRMSCNMSEAVDRYSRIFPDKTVVAVVVLMDMGRAHEHPVEGLVDPGLCWAGDARIPVLDEAGFFRYLEVKLLTREGAREDARLVDLVQAPEGYRPARSDKPQSEGASDDSDDSSVLIEAESDSSTSP